MLDNQGGRATEELRHMVATHMHGLATLLLGGGGDIGLPELGLRAARLRAVQTHILANIQHHALTLADVARSQQISNSYIRQLLAETGPTFTDFVLGGRLT